MPISIVAGGQYGSEGKGKVALHLAREHGPEALVVRVGGSNSGHTAFDRAGNRHALRQLPAGAVDGNPMLIAPGSYIDVEVLLNEMVELGATPGRLAIDPQARLITEAHKRWEEGSKLTTDIGSTASGTGAAVIAAAARNAPSLGLPSPRACDDERLSPFLRPASEVLAEQLKKGQRVIVEGTQGFGLSVIHGEWPYVTSRDTTAAAFLSEIGRGPADVDEMVLVLRSHAIRVAGTSGRLAGETQWDEIRAGCGADRDITEMTTVTGKVRRVGAFDAEIVRAAIAANTPTRVVLNHVDHWDWSVRRGRISDSVLRKVREIEDAIGRRVDLLGTSEDSLMERPSELPHAGLRAVG